MTGQTKKSGADIFLYIVWIVGGAFGLVFLVAMIGANTDPRELDHDQCVQEKGFGEWRGSLGVSLDDFCTAYAGIEAMKRDRREHPENY